MKEKKDPIARKLDFKAKQNPKRTAGRDPKEKTQEMKQEKRKIEMFRWRFTS